REDAGPAKRWARYQPKGGDRVVYCGHLGERTHHSWYSPGLRFRRPDGSCGEASFVIPCGGCSLRAKGDARKVPICGDFAWVGDEPAFLAPDPNESPFLR